MNTMRTHLFALLALPLALGAGCSGSQSTAAGSGDSGEGAAGSGDTGDVDVQLCDGKTTVAVDPETIKSREQGQAIADALMAQWKLANGDENWEESVTRAHPNIPEPADNSDLVAEGTQGKGHPYGRFDETDVLTWQRETTRFVREGAAVFHDAEALGSTIAVSCDMCHPDAANTHPETYPKFQTQLGRVVLLRDMINWCLQHPVRAPPMADDDPRMRAMEAYIIAQRKGRELNYGRH